MKKSLRESLEPLNFGVKRLGFPTLKKAFRENPSGLVILAAASWQM
jgi:hypothetical protein